MEANRNKQIEDYLQNRMTSNEKKSFELEMSANSELATEVKRSLLIEKTIKILGHKQIDNFLEEIRNEEGHLPEPSIGVIDQIIFFFKRRNIFALSIIPFLLIATLLLTKIIKPIENYFIPPALIHLVAGNQLPNYSKATEISSYYASNNEGELNKIANDTTSQINAIAIYYLAHLHLKNRAYTLSKNQFTKALSFKDELEKYTEFQDMILLKFNQILSEYGEEKDRESTLKALSSLKKEINNPNHLVHSKIDALANDLRVSYYFFR